MNQIERIQKMEQLFDETEKNLLLLENGVQTMHSLQNSIQQLETYYTGPLWRKDFEDDCKGLIPSDMKRGILSEDGIDNLLSRYQEVINQLKKTFQKEREV